jgi:methyltransferase-like protein
MEPRSELTPYDELPYPAAAYIQSHPSRLETLAKLFGMSPPDITRCRVLELACADGANLIPTACALPESTFVGVDLSARQLAAGHDTIAALGLANIELHRSDIRNVNASFGAFDYIIAHGVYSWVPQEVQEQILRICSEQLTENGVAHVSYNTYPGWRMRGMLRDMMLYHSRQFDDPQMQIEQARALINWLSGCVNAENSPYGMLLKRELEQMQNWRDNYFRHDSLAEINEPVYFYEFIERAERHRLQYLAEAEFPAMLASNYAAPVDEALNRLGRNIVEMEQYMDFLRNRMFRNTLLCHDRIKLNRNLGPWSLKDFHCAAFIRPVNNDISLASQHPETFRGVDDLTITSSRPIVKAAFLSLGLSWPAALRFSDLVSQARTLLHGQSGVVLQERADWEADIDSVGSALLTCYAKGLCELYVHPPKFVISPGERPLACPFARFQARRVNAVTNRRHERATLDNFGRHLIALLDGEHDRASLVDALTRLVEQGILAVEVDGRRICESTEVKPIMESQLDGKLRELGQRALLLA